MRKLSCEEISLFEEFISVAEEQAKLSTCLRAKCGTVIINQGKIIGRGFNSPPGNLESQRRCLNNKEDYDKKVTDKTCCIHSEERAVDEALKNYPKELEDSILIFKRVDESGLSLFSDKPYCTICSKRALDKGVAYWILEHKDGIYIYNAEEYNDLSFNYNEKDIKA